MTRRREHLNPAILAAAITLIATAGPSAWLLAGEPTIPPRDRFHLYLLLGQSNMAGRGEMTEEDRRPVARVLKLDEHDRWLPGSDPLHFDKSARPPGVGPGSGFGPAMAAANPTITVGLIPCAVGGTALERWVKGADLYENAIRRAKRAAKDGVLKGVIWHQGESDANSRERAETYGQRLEAMIADLRRDLGLGAEELPFVVGMLGDYFAPGKRRFAADVNAALAAIPHRIPNTACVSARGLKPMADLVHFDSFSARELGERYAAAMQELQSRSTKGRPQP